MERAESVRRRLSELPMRGGSATTGFVGGDGVAGGEADAINVLTVNNPQIVHLQQLRTEHCTDDSGIEVLTVIARSAVETPKHTHHRSRACAALDAP